MKIVVASLNPSIDWQMTVKGFVYGGLNRVAATYRYASGKGINVCAALKNLGLDPLCVGFNFRENGGSITNALDKWGVRHDFVTVDGAIRTNIKLYDAGTMTELNQSGATVSDEAVALLYDKIMTIGLGGGESASILVLCGSTPPGVPVDFYKRLCEDWPGTVILDAEGEALKLAVQGSRPPFCIKPNIFELESSFGVSFTSKGHGLYEEIAAFCGGLVRQTCTAIAGLHTRDAGLGVICVSLGAKGAMLVTGDGAYYMPQLDLPVRGLQGAGDAMVAGLVYGLAGTGSGDIGIDDIESDNIEIDNSAVNNSEINTTARLLKIASAAAAATVIREGTEMCTREDFIKYLALLPKPYLVH